MMKKQEDEAKVKLQVVVDSELARKIDELADKMKMSRSQFVAEMLEENISSEEWMVDFVTSRFMAPVRDVIQSLRNKKQKKNLATSG